MNSKRRISNLVLAFVTPFQQKLNLPFDPHKSPGLFTTFGPEDIFHYIYALFHSPTYRSRYAEFLKIDFPLVSPTILPRPLLVPYLPLAADELVVKINLKCPQIIGLKSPLFISQNVQWPPLWIL